MVWNIDNRLAGSETAEAAVLSNDMRERIVAEFEKYPTKRAVLLTALHWVQKELGYISDAAIREVAGLIEISPAEVLDTLSFYDMYSREKRGHHIIGVCRSLSCELCDCHKIVDSVKDKLGIGPGETTADNKFTLLMMECIGACEYAPVILMDESLHKIDSVEALDKVIAAQG
jgi:NADH-quinone oxidoreductase subunit E